MAVACNAVNGVTDLQLVECATCADAGESDDAPGSLPPPKADSGGNPSKDSGSDAPVIEAGPTGPSHCQGITFWAPLEGNGTSAAVSGAKAGETGAGTYVAEATGKLGQGFRGNAAGATLTWPTPYQGVSAVDPAQGTVAVWIRLNFGNFPEPKRVWFQPLAGAAATSPALYLSNTDLVLAAEGGATASVDLSQIPGVLANNRPWILAVGTWKAGAVMGSTSLGLTVIAPTLTLNGTYKNPWTPGAPPTSFRLGFNANGGSNASFDELILWDHPLSDADIKTVSELTTPIGQACK